MGRYINHLSNGRALPALGKADILLTLEPGVKEIGRNEVKFQPNLVVVVSNGSFEAAAYCYSEREFQEFLDSPYDQRERRWLIVPTVELLA